MSQVRVLGELAVLDDVGPARRGRAYPAAGATSALLLPAAVLLGGLVLWPVLRTMHASVTTDGRWVGAAHFRTALAAPGTGAVVGRTVLWALLVPAVVTALGYLLAAASRRSEEGGLVRLILLVPVALPLVVTGVTFRLMYDPDPSRGLATLVATRLSGRSVEDAPQLLGPGMVTVALMSAFVWAWVGLAVLVFRSALDAVPPSLADAVRAYGGKRRHVLWDAQWRPLLLRTTAVVFALVAVGTSRTFDLILVMTPGSVRDEASVLALRIWQTSGGTTTGDGAALGVVWLVAVIGGIMVAALFVRQAWPPPRVEATPEPAPVAPPRRVFRLLAAGAAIAWLVPLAVLV
ncbi:carbohydrate ABC transporter permease, partial [Micromonospora foliorum]|uniref:carbohydrate ABC transporter permease n=1 Tax=Micromonospora foliorum TaxID=2911210 RepID=UPI001EE8E1A2